MGEEQNKSWYSSVIETIANSYTKVLEAVKKHGMMVSLFVMVLFVLLWSLIINPIRFNDMIEMQWKHHIENEKNVKDVMVQRRYDADEVVGGIMTNIMDKYKANRIILLEKHNSVQSLGNVDFLYLSCTMEQIDITRDEMDYISDDLQRQIVPNLLGNQMINLLRHRPYLYYNLENYKRSECRLLMKLKKIGEREVLMIPFSDKNNRPLLIMVICGDNLNVDGIVNYVDGYKKQISDLLIF